MSPTAKLPPVWLLGFGLWPLGVNGALLLFTMPQLLAAEHAPEARIAAITSMAVTPGFLSFLRSRWRSAWTRCQHVSSSPASAAT
jgi:hypothetical protein